MLRDSKYCEGFAIYKDGKLKYSCDSNIESLSEKEKSFYNCDFYDMEEYSQCYKCPLSCKKNKSVVKKLKITPKEGLTPYWMIFRGGILLTQEL